MRRADAQTTEVYNDAKAIIEELVTREASQQLAKTIGCRIDGAMVYFPRTLQSVYDQQFGSVKSVAQDEVIELLAYQVYLRALGKGKPLHEAKQWELIRLPDGNWVDSVWQAGQKFDDCKAGLDVKFRAKSLSGTNRELLDGACAKPAGDDRLACALAIATRATLQGDLKTAEERIAEALAVLLRRELVSRFGVTLSDSSADRITAVLRIALIEQKVDATDLWDALDAILKEEKQSVAAAAAEAYVVSSLRPLVAEWQALAGSTGLKLANFLATSLSPREEFTEGGKTAIRAAGSIANICSLERKDEKITYANLTDACKYIAQLAVFFSHREAMAAFEAAQKRDYKALATTALQALGGDGATECTKELEETDKEKVLDKQECPMRARNARYLRFATATFNYVFDVAQGTPTEARAASFREATIEVIEELEPKGAGIRRRFWEKLYLPELGLRYSWNPSYLNESGSNNSRTVASLDFLGLRGRVVYRDTAYGAVQFSLIDLLAPFSEVASRKSVNYEDSKYWYNLVTPRLEGLFGMPAFSHRLVLATGASLRMAAAYQPQAVAGAAASTPKYLTLFGEHAPGDSQGDHFLRFLEFNVAVKYLL